MRRVTFKGRRADVKGNSQKAGAGREGHTRNREGGRGKGALPVGALLHPLVLHHLHPCASNCFTSSQHDKLKDRSGLEVWTGREPEPKQAHCMLRG